MDQMLTSALQSLTSLHQDGELAYLALTSKVELPFRDRLAWALQGRIGSDGAVVAREWKERVDLAVLRRPGQPEALIEVKAMHAFDLFKDAQRARFKNAVEEDRRKLERFTAKHAFQSAHSYVLALVTACGTPPAVEHDGVVKYLKHIAKDGQRSSADVHAAMLACFDHPRVADGTVAAGTAFGVPVEIHYALYRIGTEPAR